MKVETFQHRCQAESLPPTLEWVSLAVEQALPKKSRILQWAIVKSNPKTRELWIEGSYIRG
jgi:hypothetical protein